MLGNNLIDLILSTSADLVENFSRQGRYYQKIKTWDKNNQKRKKPRSYLVFTLDKEDAIKNATFSTYELGIKEHMIARAYLTKSAGLLPMNKLKYSMLRLAGVQIEDDVFIAPEVTIDPVLRGWTRFRKGSSLGWGVKCFNHLFEDNGKIIIGYVDVGEESSVGGFVSLGPGVTIGRRVSIGAEAKIAPGATICDYAKIGACAIISPFITIGEGSEVTLGSLVTESIPPNTKVQGNPAKTINGKIKDRQTRNKKPKLDLIVNPGIEKEA